MICPSCRTLIDEGAEFCSSCLGPLGAGELAAAAVASPSPPPQVEPAPFAERFPAQQPCAEHPEFPIAGTCARCGRFVCIRCAPELATQDLASCAACSSRADSAPQGIGGWLLVVSLGVVLGPVGMGLSCFGIFGQLHRSYARVGHLVPLQWAIGAVYVFGVLLALYQVGVAIAFFGRKRVAPRLLIGSLAGYVVFCLVRLLVEADMADSLVSRNVELLIRSLAPAAIWIPYLLVSKRVKATFVK